MRASTSLTRPLAGLLLLASSHAALSAPEWPDQQAIEAARKTHPFPTPSELAASAVPLLPRLDVAPALTDLRRLLTPVQPLESKPDSTAQPLLVFITLGMPRASLVRIVEQAERSGAVLALRGLQAQSMRETLKAVSELIGQHRISLNLDPEAFRRYRVTEAPSVVLRLTPDAVQCTDVEAPGDSYLKISGDVSLDYALEAMRRARPAAAALVSPLLARLRRS